MTEKKRHFCYLAGNISDDPKTYAWRREFHREVAKHPEMKKGLVVLDPTKNKFNLRVKPSKKYDGTEKEMIFERAKEAGGFGVLPKKDYCMIKICTIIVCNLKYVHPQKPMIGTVFELEWARQLMIPVIAIVDESNPACELYSRHPFTNECISERVETVAEAVALIDRFFMEA